MTAVTPTGRTERVDGAASESPAPSMARAGGLAPEALASIRAECKREAGQHPWRKAWSVKRLREQHAEQTERARSARAA